MKRLLIATAVAAAAASSFAAPASAVGYCDEKIEVACNRYPCTPDYPCTPSICLVYMAPRCVV